MLPVLTEKERRSPFHTMIMFLCIMTGSAYILGMRDPALSGQPNWAGYLWNSSLVLFGVLSISSAYIKDVLYSKLIARTSMAYMAALSGIFAVSLVLLGSPAPDLLLSAVLILAFSGACTKEALRAHRDLRKLRKWRRP